MMYVCVIPTSFEANSALQAEPYKFSHFILFTRTYRLSPEEEAEVNGRLPGDQGLGSKRRKPVTPRLSGATSDNSGGICSFHPEDDIIQKVL